MSGNRGSLDKVYAGIAAAEKAGLSPIKINVVVQRGVNDDGVLDVLERFRGTGHIVRLIEFMDVGSSNGWQREEVFTSRQIRDLIDSEMPIESADPNYEGEVAVAEGSVPAAGRGEQANTGRLVLGGGEPEGVEGEGCNCRPEGNAGEETR